MTAAELIEQLRQMPPDARVFHLWDGELRTEINHVWLARNGMVATADNDESCYEGAHRPASAPTEDRFWSTPSVRSR